MHLTALILEKIAVVFFSEYFAPAWIHRFFNSKGASLRIGCSSKASNSLICADIFLTALFMMAINEEMSKMQKKKTVIDTPSSLLRFNTAWTETTDSWTCRWFPSFFFLRIWKKENYKNFSFKRLLLSFLGLSTAYLLTWIFQSLYSFIESVSWLLSLAFLLAYAILFISYFRQQIPGSVFRCFTFLFCIFELA